MATTTDKLAPGHRRSDTQRCRAGGNNLPADHTPSDTHASPVRGNPSASDHRRSDTHIRPVGGNGATPDQSCRDAHATAVGGGPSYADLLIWSETLSDLERVRIAVENRIRAAEQGNITVDALGLGTVLDRLRDDEAYTTKQLEKAMKRHPLGPWVQAQKGVGLKQMGRLLGVVGDPYVRAPEFNEDKAEVAPARPRRGPAELWAYCGFHTVSVGDHRTSDTQPRLVPDGNIAPRHQRGVQGNWNDAARMRAYLIAESCMKTSGPYREVYDRGREKYAETVHAHPCPRCGPSGKPAAVGSPLSAGHQHARALRLVAKEVLKGLYNEAKRLYELAPGHLSCDTHGTPAGGN